MILYHGEYIMLPFLVMTTMEFVEGILLQEYFSLIPECSVYLTDIVILQWGSRWFVSRKDVSEGSSFLHVSGLSDTNIWEPGHVSVVGLAAGCRKNVLSLSAKMKRSRAVQRFLSFSNSVVIRTDPKESF
jgi:hypothetical protein